MATPEDYEEFPEANDPKYKPNKPCNARLDELAKPNKRLVLGLWENFAHHFSPERREAIRLQVQELYAMTPEDTAAYFGEINKVLKRMAQRQKLRERLARRYRQRIWHVARQQAYLKFGQLLRKHMLQATKRQLPPFVSPRIRNMADVILEQLCDIRSLPVPQRSTNDDVSQFLITIADWLAIGIEHIYFEIQVKKNSELDDIEAQLKAQEEEERAKSGNRRRSKGSRGSAQRAQNMPPPVTDDTAPEAY